MLICTDIHTMLLAEQLPLKESINRKQKQLSKNSEAKRPDELVSKKINKHQRAYYFIL